MQFKLLAIAAAGMLAAALFAITPAQAEPKIGSVYSVLSFDIAGVNYSGGAAKIAPRILYGADMAVGIRALKGVDLEAGFSGLWGHDDVNTAIQGAHFDAIAHVQLVGPVDLLVDGGFTYLDGEISHGTFHAGSYEWGWRAGAGFEVPLTDHLGFRALSLYHQNSFNGLTSGAIVANVGFKYSF